MFFKQDPNLVKTEVKTDDDAYRGPMKNFEKPKSDVQNSPDQQPPAKKRRVDGDSGDSINAKLNEIRNNMDSKDQSSAHNAQSPSKKDKKKKKNKNKLAQQNTDEQSTQPDFDYSNVDFKKFGGGSIVEQKNEIKMKFHGKVCFGFYLEKNQLF